MKKSILFVVDGLMWFVDSAIFDVVMAFGMTFVGVVGVLIGIELQKVGHTTGQDVIDQLPKLLGLAVGWMLCAYLPGIITELLTTPIKPHDADAVTDTGHVTVDK